MKKDFCLFLCLFLIFVSCHRNEGKNTLTVDFSEFPTENVDSLHITVHPDSIYLIGSIKSIPDGYMMYIYDKENAYLITDKTFKYMMETVHKGESPEEVRSGGTKYGQVLDTNGNVAISDPYKHTFYALDTKTGILGKLIDFPQEFSRYSPSKSVKIKDGSFVSPRGDFQYGLVSFNPETDQVYQWPVGIEDIDTEHPISSHVSMRVIDYNQKNGIIAEIYGELPFIVLHNENGEIVKIITLKGTPRESKEGYDFIGDLKLTDDYIIVLWGDTEIDNENTILFMSYDGKPIKQIKIQPAQSFDFDEEFNRILTTNTEWEDTNLIIYNLN